MMTDLAPDVTDIVLRQAEEADLPSIVLLLMQDTLGQIREDVEELAPYYAAWDAMSAQPDNFMLVATTPPDHIVGCLQLTFIASLSHLGAERAQIESVRVAAEMRGRGVGRRMIEHAMALATARGARIAQLTTDKRRTDSRRFYESLGFQATHEGMKRLL